MKAILVTPAYGRDYLNKEQALAAWRDGKDFVCYGSGGTYINNEDAKTAGFQTVTVKFRKKTLLLRIDVATEQEAK